MDRAMDRAVDWLKDRGGSGVLDKFGKVLARGDSAITVDAVTWIRCVFCGRLKVEHGRIYVPEPEAVSPTPTPPPIGLLFPTEG
jgi:hypothetical protein